MSDQDRSEPGPTIDKEDPEDAKLKVEEARAKQQKAEAEAEAEQAERRAEAVEEEAQEAKRPEGKKTPAKEPVEDEPADDESDEEVEVVEKVVGPKQKPELDEETSQALAARTDKKAKTPAFRRHEWWRYKKLGGKNAPWRRPRGIHSKQRRHFKYRPPVVSIGYRGPRAARGLHPSGFEEVLVHRPEDLAALDPKTQAARVGGTVGGRKAELIEKEADNLGIRVLNRRS